MDTEHETMVEETNGGIEENVKAIIKANKSIGEVELRKLQTATEYNGHVAFDADTNWGRSIAIRH